MVDCTFFLNGKKILYFNFRGSDSAPLSIVFGHNRNLRLLKNNSLLLFFVANSWAKSGSSSGMICI